MGRAVRAWSAALVMCMQTAACGGGNRPAPATAPATPPVVAQEAPTTPPAATDRGQATAGPCNTTDACATECAKPSASGCLRLGLLVQYGVAFPEPRYLALMRAGCQSDVMAACWFAGELMTRRQQGLASENEEAKRVYRAEAPAMLKKACDGDQAPACRYLAYRESDPAAAKELDAMAEARWRADCDANDANACAQLANHLDHESIENGGGFSKDAEPLWDRAAVLMKEECEHGDALTCYDLASDYTNDGYAVLTDEDKSREYANRTCALSQELCPNTRPDWPN